MNYDQLTGIIRAWTPVLLGVFTHWFASDTAALIVAALGATAAAIWSVLNNKTGKVVG